jgi:hypothetical protein
MEDIGVVMNLEKKMKNKRKLIGLGGVIKKGMDGVKMI